MPYFGQNGIDYSISYYTHGWNISDSQAQHVADSIGWDLIRQAGYGMIPDFMVDGRRYALNIQGSGQPASRSDIYVIDQSTAAGNSAMQEGIHQANEAAAQAEKNAQEQGGFFENLFKGTMETIIVVILGGVALYALIQSGGRKSNGS